MDLDCKFALVEFGESDDKTGYVIVKGGYDICKEPTKAHTYWYPEDITQEEAIKEDFVNKVTNAIKACDLPAATDANSGYDLKMHSVNVKWEWAYETDEAISLKDTALATKATRPTIKIDVTCTVTQVD